MRRLEIVNSRCLWMLAYVRMNALGNFLRAFQN
jgi:hypothetical protein